MKLVWKIKIPSMNYNVIWDSFSEAKDDYKHFKTNGYKYVYLYPKLISSAKYNNLKEFQGF